MQEPDRDHAPAREQFAGWTADALRQELAETTESIGYLGSIFPPSDIRQRGIDALIARRARAQAALDRRA